MQPPYSNRGVTPYCQTVSNCDLSQKVLGILPHQTYKIDWLTLTKPSMETYGTDDLLSVAASIGVAFVSDYASCPPLKGYRSGVRLDSGAYVCGAPPPQGVIVQLSGESLARCDGLAIAERAIALGWRVTRLDIAVDMVGYKTSVDDYIECVDAGLCNTKAKTTAIAEKRQVIDGVLVTGKTLYIGSRSSERFMRVYDKRSEQAQRFGKLSGLPDSWVRCELQLGDEHARSALGAMMEHGSSVVPELMRGFCDFTQIQEYVSMSDCMTDTKGAGKKETNTRAWLLETVFPTLLRECEQSTDFRLAWEKMYYDASRELKLKKRV